MVFSCCSSIFSAGKLMVVGHSELKMNVFLALVRTVNGSRRVHGPSIFALSGAS